MKIAAFFYVMSYTMWIRNRGGLAWTRMCLCLRLEGGIELDNRYVFFT
jgi:hypothetical protein